MIDKIIGQNSITSRPIQSLFFFFVIAVSVGLLATPYYQYAVIPGLLVLFLLLLGHFPQIGYYLIFFLIPLSAFTGISKSYDFLTISKFVGAWVLIVILFYFLLNKKNSFNIQSNLWPWLLFFFLISFVSALMSDYYSTSFDNLRKLLIAYTFFAMTLIFISSQNVFCKILPAIIILSVSVSSLAAVVGNLFELSFFVNPSYLGREVGTTSNPNYFAGLIIFSLPLFAHWFFSSR